MLASSRVVSLWDMLHKLDVEGVMGRLTRLGSWESVLGFDRNTLVQQGNVGKPVAVHAAGLSDTEFDAQQISKIAEELSLPGIGRVAGYLISLCQEGRQNGVLPWADFELLITHIRSLIAMTINTLADQNVFMLSMDSAKLIKEQGEHFGQSVAAAFPSAAYDIEEAAKCRAYERWTASVTHLMRALDVGLKVFQAHLAVNVAKENWQDMINQIEAKIKANGHKHADHQWNSEAVAHFRVLKDAWRNHAMHGVDRYDEERAVSIYEAVKGFMHHLSGRVSEAAP